MNDEATRAVELLPCPFCGRIMDLHVEREEPDHWKREFQKMTAERDEFRAEVDRINRVAATGTIGNWLKLPDEDKAKWFATMIHESSERKKERERAEAAESALREREGMVMVPREPTIEMMLAMRGTYASCRRKWKCALEAYEDSKNG